MVPNSLYGPFLCQKNIKGGGYKGRSPPKPPKFINLQMPISQNKEMALNILRHPKFKYREIGNQYADTLKRVAKHNICVLSEGN